MLFQKAAAAATNYTAWGFDYAFGNGLTIDTLKANGTDFVCRYLSYLPNPKVVSKAEVEGLVAAGIKVVFNWEFTGQEVSEAQGIADATEALGQLKALGAVGAPVIFSLDRAAPPDTADPVKYAHGVAKVMPWAEIGHYGDFGWMQVVFGQNLGKFGWQTYAWSGSPTVWHPKAQLQQYQNGVKVGPAQVDRDRATAIDYGQWPRPDFNKVHNPVEGAHVTHRGWTSISLAWSPQPNARDYTVVTTWRGEAVSTLTVTDPAVRVGHLKHGRTYDFSIRAHPGVAGSRDAHVKATTK